MKKLEFDAEDVSSFQWVTVNYFIRQTNRVNGLVADKTEEGSPSSIAAVGMALSTAPIVVERKIFPREQAIEYVLQKLRFFHESPQSQAADATGWKGFYYHFLDMETGRRTWNCELSTIDTALFIAGALTCAAYFDHDDGKENEIRTLADSLYRRIDWHWAMDGGATVTHGWTPEHGFIPHRWQGYDESLLLYILALGSPTHPIPAASYQAFTQSYKWRRLYDLDVLYSGPLFTHQFPHIWIDFREIQDAFMRDREIDYFENSRRAAQIQQRYAISNPKQFDGYGEFCWGFTASDGPAWNRRVINGVEREFFGYIARGAPDAPDDGTVAPWAVLASLPFAPEIVIPTIRNFEEKSLGMNEQYGFRSTFNETYPCDDEFVCQVNGDRWVSPYRFGIDQGPIVLMVENYCSGLLWRLMRGCPYIVNGLRAAGFTGGWLA